MREQSVKTCVCVYYDAYLEVPHISHVGNRSLLRNVHVLHDHLPACEGAVDDDVDVVDGPWRLYPCGANTSSPVLLRLHFFCKVRLESLPTASRCKCSTKFRARSQAYISADPNITRSSNSEALPAQNHKRFRNRMCNHQSPEPPRSAAWRWIEGIRLTEWREN